MIGRTYEVQPGLVARDWRIVAIGTGEAEGQTSLMTTLHDVDQDEAERQARFMQERYDQLLQIHIS